MRNQGNTTRWTLLTVAVATLPSLAVLSGVARAATPQPTQPLALRFVTNYAGVHPMAKVVRTVLGEFTADFPTISVGVEETPGNDHQTKIKLDASSDRMPDVFNYCGSIPASASTRLPGPASSPTSPTGLNPTPPSRTCSTTTRGKPASLDGKTYGVPVLMFYVEFLAGNHAPADFVALLLANALRNRIPGSRFCEAAFFVPVVISSAAISLLFTLLYDPDIGLVNAALKLIGLGQFGRAWLADRDTALYAVIAVPIWHTIGYFFVILLAAMRDIPRELYEAARIDGAGGRTTFTHITVPSLVPVLTVCAVLAVLVPAVSVLPMTFRLFNDIGPLGTKHGIALIYATEQLRISIFLLVTFMRAIPHELDEAALIDGCNLADLFFGVVLPLSRNGIITVVILAFVAIWNDYLTALVLLPDQQNRTLSVALAFAKDEYRVDYGMMSAAIVFAVAPMLLLYLVLKERIAVGMAAGAVKG